MRLEPPGAVREIARRLEEAGHEAWAVGGAVRDALLGIPGGDWDLATSARPARVRRLFPRTVPIGVEHGTVGVLGDDGVLYEVTTFRRDVETTGRHAVIEFADSLEEDLARRDFTCNAIAWHPGREELRDPFGGAGDLRSGVLRAVGEPAERFAEDHLRILRALRFAGQYDLAIEPTVWGALTGMRPSLLELSAERVREELWKVLEKQRRASASLSLYAASGALEVLYPELQKVLEMETELGPDFQPWTETLRAVDAIAPSRTMLRVAALLHRIGVPAARSRDLRGGWRFTGFEVMGGRAAGEVMLRLKASNAHTDRVRALVELQSELFPPDATGRVVRRWLREVGTEHVNDLFRLRFARWRAEHPAATGIPDDLLTRWRMARLTLRERPPLSVADLAIGGRELRGLGYAPGPRFGTVLHQLLERVLDDPELNTPDRLLAIAREELAD